MIDLYSHIRGILMDTVELWSDSIKKISGVKYVKIKGDVNQLESIHIVTNGVKSPKQIVRDVEAVLLAMFNYQIDHKIISVAQLELEEVAQLDRVKYEGLNVRIEGAYIACEVQLSHKDQMFSYTQKGIKTTLNRYLTIAKGTIGCMEQIMEGQYFLDIIDIQMHQTKGIEFVTVMVQVISTKEDEILIGTAIIREDSYEAVVRATLDAINRRIMK